MNRGSSFLSSGQPFCEISVGSALIQQHGRRRRLGSSCDRDLRTSAFPLFARRLRSAPRTLGYVDLSAGVWLHVRCGTLLESSVGPYNAAVTRVSEEQLLLNVVRLRYNDNPTRLDVASIAAQYELDASAEARPFFAAPNPAGAVFETFGAILPDLMASGANRPTISLTPLDDPETIRGLFTPATLDGIVFLAETSYPLSTVFQLFVESINGVPNAPSASGPPRGIVPEFREFKRAAEILQQLKDLGDLQFVREEKLSEYGSRLSESSVTAGCSSRPQRTGSSTSDSRTSRGRSSSASGN